MWNSEILTTKHLKCCLSDAGSYLFKQNKKESKKQVAKYSVKEQTFLTHNIDIIK